MTGDEWAVLARCGAFWAGLLAFGRRDADAGDRTRFALGLAAGALATRAGWLLLHRDGVPPTGLALLSPAGGHAVAFVWVGPLALVPWRSGAARRARHLAALGFALPVALGAARLGCLAAGCCRPTAPFELAALGLLAGTLTRLPGSWLAPAGVAGAGLVRLLAEPWRAAPPLGPPLLSPAALAAVWIAAGALLALAGQRSANHPHPVDTVPMGRSPRCTSRRPGARGSTHGSWRPFWASRSRFSACSAPAGPSRPRRHPGSPSTRGARSCPCPWAS